MYTERQMAANPQTKPTDLGCEFNDKWLAATIHIHRHHLLLLLSTKADTYFTIPQMVEGQVDLGTAGKVQPVPKTVYRCRRRDKHNYLSHCSQTFYQ